MTKGLRCPSCDTTINRRVIHDWIVNKKAPYLNCINAFCSTRWKRAVLEANAAQFLGEAKKPKTAAPKAKTPKEVVSPKAMSAADIPVVNKGNWLDRIRGIARHRVKAHGVVAIDDLRQWADQHNDHPPYPSTWGSVFQPAEWKKVSRKRSSYASSRSRKINVWTLVQQAVTA
jgi:hypothetical protein